MLSAAQLAALSVRIGANADRIIQTTPAKTRRPSLSVERQEHSTKPASITRRGRPAKRIANPFYGLIGPTTAYGRYPFFAQDTVEGIARLDWHDRPIGRGGSSKPLSVRSLMTILEAIEEVTTESVAEIIRTKTRQLSSSCRWICCLGRRRFSGLRSNSQRACLITRRAGLSWRK